MSHPSLAFWILDRLSDFLWLYSWIIVIAVVMSWLIAFGVVNTFHPFTRGVIRFLDAVTEPVFRQIRRVIPPIGGLDLSPLIVYFIVQFFLQWAIPDVRSYVISY